MRGSLVVGIRKEKQEELLRQKNEETLKRLTAAGGDGGGATSTSGRPTTEIVAYRSVADIPAIKDLVIQVSTGEGIYFKIVVHSKVFQLSVLTHVHCHLFFSFLLRISSYMPARLTPRVRQSCCQSMEFMFLFTSPP
jgi:hypothetical protein